MFAMFNFLKKSNWLEEKYAGEIQFWKMTIGQYVAWYKGKISLYEEKPPTSKQKVKGYSDQDSAILTWGKVHQEKKYLKDLQLKPNAFAGKKILDVGSGPHPSALCFRKAQVYCLEPLLPQYLEIGFPLHYYPLATFVHAQSENIPFPKAFFDGVISVNAIDHVDDIEKTAKEIKRVLKPGGKLRMHIHYHKKTQAEPIELNDERVKKLFGWCKGFRKIDESSKKTGFTLTNSDETYTLWSN